MADELSITMRMKINNLINTPLDIKPQTFSADWPTDSFTRQSIATSTSFASLPTAIGISVFGWAYMHNTDPTNTIQVGTVDTGTFYPLIEVQPGEYAMFRSGKGNGEVFAQSVAGTPILEYMFLGES